MNRVLSYIILAGAFVLACAGALMLFSEGARKRKERRESLEKARAAKAEKRIHRELKNELDGLLAEEPINENNNGSITEEKTV